MAGEARIVQCGHCDFASGMRGMDRCGKCDGTGAQIVMPDGTRHALSDAGLRSALAAARRAGAEAMRERAAGEVARQHMRLLAEAPLCACGNGRVPTCGLGHMRRAAEDAIRALPVEEDGDDA